MPSVRRTHRVITDPLGLLLDAYERHGPVFSLRVLTHARGVHARPGGEPPHPGLARVRLHLARRRLRRPDPAARRRPADDRRRVPPPLAQDHAARVPPRADRRRAGRDGDRDRARGRAVAGGRPDRPVRMGEGARAARRDARAVRPRPGPPPGWARPGARVRARARLLRARLLAAGAARPAHAVGGADRRAPAPRRADLLRDRPPPGERRARRRPALAAARRGRRGRRAAERRARARRGDDAPVRRPRHDDGDDRVPVPRARAAAGRRRRDRRRAAMRSAARRATTT